MRRFHIALVTGLVVVLTVVGLVLAFLALPNLLVPDAGLKPKERLELRNGVRTSAVQAIGGFMIALGTFVTAWNVLGTLRLNREGQITDRFTKAVELLSSDQLDGRLGGIYALERIARDSRRDHGPVMSILTAYLHARSSLAENHRVEAGRREDVQAALTVIGRRNAQYEAEDERLDLSALDLRVVRLKVASLKRVNLAESDLSGAFLDGSDLRSANLINTTLKGTRLNRVKLNEANLMGAQLQGAELKEAALRGAKLTDADLSGADLTEAKGADVHEARTDNATRGL